MVVTRWLGGSSKLGEVGQEGWWEHNNKQQQAQTKNYTLFLDSTLNPLRILNGSAHLDGEHIIGKGLMRGFERW